MSIEDVVNEVSSYIKDCSKIRKAYEIAALAHKKQKRDSGEPYIIHPLNVCMNLTKFHADEATLCAGLLHDVVEDTNYTLGDITALFGSEVAFLVDGVTKISNLHFYNKDDAANANIRRLINSLNDDVRIMLIKLCDRLHNMQTLKHKTFEKQIRNAEETLNIFVPIAYSLGAFRIKCELEDLCLYYLKPQVYAQLKAELDNIAKVFEPCINMALNDVKDILEENGINYDFRIKILNVYLLYEKMNKGYKLSNIHDIISFKIIVEDESTCYRVLGLIHKLYTPVNNKFKDYIACPKTNKYRSLHTTVFAPDDRLLQFQIKTAVMDEINTLGLGAYFDMYKKDAAAKMREELKENYQFFNSLQDLNAIDMSDKDFMDKVQQEIFSNNIYVYSLNGEIFELPPGSTIIDFAYKIHTDIGNHLYKAYVNGKEVPITQVLNNKDRIYIVQKENSYPTEEWLEHTVTSKAKRKIKEFLK